MYQKTVQNVLTELDSRFTQNRAMVQKVFDPLVSLCRDLLNSQYRVAGSFTGLLQNSEFTGHGQNLKAIFKAFHANLFHFHAALQLTEQGLVGSVGPILRVVFEGLLVAKYCSLSQDDRFFEHWERGGIFEIKKGILAKIEWPELRETRGFWEGLCRLSHSTIYAGQVDASPKEIVTEISGTYCFLLMLLLCNYHLMNRHLLTPRIVYYINRYKLDDEFQVKRRTARLMVKSALARVNPNAKLLVREYAASWKI